MRHPRNRYAALYVAAAVMLLAVPADAKPLVEVVAHFDQGLVWLEDEIAAKKGADDRFLVPDAYLGDSVVRALGMTFPLFDFTRGAERPNRTIHVVMQASDRFGFVKMKLCLEPPQALTATMDCPSGTYVAIPDVVQGANEKVVRDDVIYKRMTTWLNSNEREFLELLRLPVKLPRPRVVSKPGEVDTGLTYRITGARYGMFFQVVIGTRAYYFRSCRDEIIAGDATEQLQPWRCFSVPLQEPRIPLGVAYDAIYFMGSTVK